MLIRNLGTKIMVVMLCGNNKSYTGQYHTMNPCFKIDLLFDKFAETFENCEISLIYSDPSYDLCPGVWPD